ncbi:MAG TPA: hypothetical protein VNJ08_12225 [Bacteriovoracaceae bacterium]|nr:hypothetical protein [Bacteriovoracaceae bacterium]
MLNYIEVMKNYLELDVFLANASWVHISEKHPEISIEMIRKTILEPDFVLMSEINPSAVIYFLRKNPDESKIRFSVIIVKCKEDGLWISTAMTKNKDTGGIEIYRRLPC